MIREHIRVLFKRSGLTQTQLARESSVTQANISDYLRRKADLTTESADRILSVLRRYCNMVEDEWHPPKKKGRFPEGYRHPVPVDNPKLRTKEEVMAELYPERAVERVVEPVVEAVPPAPVVEVVAEEAQEVGL